MQPFLNAGQTDFGPAVTKMVKHNAKRLARLTPSFRPGDRNDIEQELALHLWRRLPKYDPSRGTPLTFVDRILTNRVISMIEHAAAARRDRRRERPIDAAPGRAYPGDDHLRDLKLDVAEVLSRLPDDLRPLARLFMTFNQAEVIRLTGGTRGGVRHASRRIAEHFAACGIRQNPRPTTKSRGDPVSIDRRSSDVVQPHRGAAGANKGRWTLKAIDAPASGIETIRDSLALLHEPGQVFEARIPKCHDRPGSKFTSVASGYFNDIDAAAKAIATLDAQARCEGIYVTLNPCNPALLARSANRIKEKAQATTTDSDIVARHWLLIDCDPRRPSGISATDAEVQAAIERALAIRDALSDAPPPIVAMSGNGGHLLYPIDLPRDDGGLVERVLKGLDAKFSDDAVGVDVSVHNPARIVKVIGTWARKGDDLRGGPGIEARPHRQSYFIEVPA